MKEDNKHNYEESLDLAEGLDKPRNEVGETATETVMSAPSETDHEIEKQFSDAEIVGIKQEELQKIAGPALNMLLNFHEIKSPDQLMNDEDKGISEEKRKELRDVFASGELIFSLMTGRYMDYIDDAVLCFEPDRVWTETDEHLSIQAGDRDNCRDNYILRGLISCWRNSVRAYAPNRWQSNSELLAKIEETFEETGIDDEKTIIRNKVLKDLFCDFIKTGSVIRQNQEISDTDRLNLIQNLGQKYGIEPDDSIPRINLSSRKTGLASW